MIELNGKYATAKVFTDMVDPKAISQVVNLLNQPYVEGSKVRMMPDIHAGAGCTIGTTMTITDKVCPNLVGVDIGCGMETVKIEEKDIDLEKLDNLIRAEIPSGFNIRDEAHEYARYTQLEKLWCVNHVDIERAKRSIGTLGGGNHFVEANRDDDGNIYIVVHSGSRHLGVEIASWYQETGYEVLTEYSAEKQRVIAELKAQGRQAEIQKTLQEMKSKRTNIPKPLAYVEGKLLEMYLHDMVIAQNFADLNRRAIIDTIISGMGFHEVDLSRFVTVHNYIDTKNGILRKGAVSAYEGEKLLIPINMRDGSLICIGKGNPDWNYSAPHGAGRLMSRSAAKERFTVDEFKEQMQGIYTTSVDQSTIDECPMAYKPMEAIVDNIHPTADIVAVIKPIYNFKAGGE